MSRVMSAIAYIFAMSVIAYILAGCSEVRDVYRLGHPVEEAK